MTSPAMHRPQDRHASRSHDPPRRAEKKLATRIRLLDAAQKVFAARGFADASLDEIAEVAGLTKGAVYSNFDKKLDLLLAVLDERMNRRFMAITDDRRHLESPPGASRRREAGCSWRRSKKSASCI